MIFMMSPKPVPLITWPASQPAIAPINNEPMSACMFIVMDVTSPWPPVQSIALLPASPKLARPEQYGRAAITIISYQSGKKIRTNAEPASKSRTNSRRSPDSLIDARRTTISVLLGRMFLQQFGQ
jgi:hypothetical protein